MSILDDARRLATTDTSMAVSNPEWRRLVAALIAEIEASAVPAGSVVVPKEQLERWLETLQWEQDGEPINSYTALAIGEIKAMLSAGPTDTGERVKQ